ncbi:MAG TPA: hypothetical protein VN749_04605 [Candidatus Eisenbacteria bacterium]|jgi:FtsH-binding integral membrane protein|nr:hypothetical protein [Candidatus Eisenbacteria bacterium]
MPTELAGVPIWLLLFVAAGFLLFFFKIAGGGAENREDLSKLRIFFLIATILFAIAGIADFVIWARPSS